MKANILILMAIAAAAMFAGCGDIEPVNRDETDEEGRLIKISGRIDRVHERIPNTDPNSTYPYQGHTFKFTELEPGAYTIRLCVEKEVDGEPVVFDIARTTVSKDGSFNLQIPTVVESAWLGNIYDEVEGLLAESHRDPFEEFYNDGVPGDISISNPDADACIAVLYLERSSDGQRYYIYYGGPDKDSDHVTDLSAVSSSNLLYASTAVDVTGTIKIGSESGRYGYPRAFEVASPGGWSWLYCVSNGMSGYIGWQTTYPRWAVMSYSARAIYRD